MMNVETSALVVLGTLACVATVRLIYREVCGFTSRTPNDVFPFLLKIDMEALYGTFHPEVEESFKKNLPSPEFKRVQWKRFHLAIHYSNHISHNARVFLDWTRHERKQGWQEMAPGMRKNIQELRVACIQSQLAAFIIRMRLRWWLLRMALLPFAAPPSFAELAHHGSPEMIAFYETAKALAEIFSLAYGEDYHQKLMQAL